jgi:hypothetical protein
MKNQERISRQQEMFSLSSTFRYYFYNSAADMRKGFDGLSGLVHVELGRRPVSGEVFIFVNHQRDKIKLRHLEQVEFVKILGLQIHFCHFCDMQNWQVTYTENGVHLTADLYNQILTREREQEAEILYLKQELTKLKWMIFGSKSERHISSDPSQLNLALVYYEPLEKLICFDYQKGRGRDGPQRAEYVPERMQKLYLTEREAKEKAMSAEQRKDLRAEKSLPVLQELEK